MNPINNKQPDGGNLMLAMALCVAVLVAWQFFYAGPQMERQRLAAQQAKREQTTTTPAAPGAPSVPAATGAASPAQPMTRETALQLSGARVTFDNTKVDGSIRLTGAQIDNLRLKDYRETIDPKSPEIVFLTPSGPAGATFAEIGWAAAPGSTTPVPTASTVWTAEPGANLTPATPITLSWANGQGLVFKRKIALDDNYMFTVTDTVENQTGAPVTLFPFAIVSREGEPTGHQKNWILHEGMFGVLDGTLQDKTTYAEMREYESKELKVESTGGWVGITDKYWMATLIPPQNEKFTGRFSLANEGGKEIFRADYLLGPRNVPAGAASTVTHHVYAGAKVVSLIEDYEQKLGIYRFNMSIDWGWFSIITYWMFKGLDWLNKLVGNFGVAIILLTIVVKAIFFPLANRSYESMAKMKKVQPQMKEIQERYKDDRVEQQKHMAELFRRENVNPMMGCLPIFVQIPVFFSLYKVLFVTIEMRHAPFFGWIQDLAAADPTSIFNLFGLLPYSVPSWLMIGVWPLAMGVTMWLQSKMNPPATDPVQQQMMVMMPPVFTYLMAQFPAGLVIYWTANNILSMLQQYVIMRRLNVPIEFANNFKLPWGASSKPPNKAPGE